MDRSESRRQRSDASLGAELRSSLLLLCVLLGPILGLVAIVHEHDRRAAEHPVCASNHEGCRPCAALTTTAGP